MIPSETSSSGRRAPGRVPLNRDLIVQRAMALAEAKGEQALTMRNLGRALGVEAMSLYHYFPNRKTLLEAMGNALFAPLDSLQLGSRWQTAAKRLGRTLRDLAVTWPQTFRLVGLQPRGAALAAAERLLTLAARSGARPGEALALYRAVASYARGYAVAEARGFTVDGATADGRRRLEALPADDYPTLHSQIPRLARLDQQQAFDLGLDALVAGFETRFARATRTRAPVSRRARRC